MKQWLGCMRDPSIHLITVTTVIIGAFLALNSTGWRDRNTASQHPANCHACSLCPPEMVAARDAYLIRTGSIAPPDTSE